VRAASLDILEGRSPVETPRKRGEVSRPLAEVLRNAPPRVKHRTGIPSLDRLTAGGMAERKMWVMVAAPSGAKTAFGHNIARQAAADGVRVEIFPADDGDETTAERFAALAGATALDVTNRAPAAIATLEGIDGIFVSPADESFEEFCERVASSPHRPLLALIDSLHAAAESCEATDARGRVELANEKLRTLCDANIIVLATSESNRSSYASRDPSKRTDPMASGAETRKIEYNAGVLLRLENREGTIHCQVVKNKCGGKTGSFLMRLDPVSLEMTEIDAAATLEEVDRTKARKQEEACGRILEALRAHGELSGRQLFQMAPTNRAEHDAARLTLLRTGRIESRPGKGQAVVWRLAEGA